MVAHMSVSNIIDISSKIKSQEDREVCAPGLRRLLQYLERYVNHNV